MTKKLTILIVFSVLLFGCAEDPRETAKLYSAWKSANAEHANITLDEWSVLRRHDMLPGIDYAKIYAKRAEKSADSAATMSAVAVGMSAGK